MTCHWWHHISFGLSTKSFVGFATSSLGRPLRGLKRLAPLAKRSTCSKSTSHLEGPVRGEGAIQWYYSYKLCNQCSWVSFEVLRMKQNKKEKKRLNKKLNKRPLLRYEHNFMWLSVFSLDCNAALGKRNLCNGLHGSFPQKGYLYQASGVWKGRNFTSWRMWKGREICLIQIFLNRSTVWPYHFNLWNATYDKRKAYFYQVCERDTIF